MCYNVIGDENMQNEFNVEFENSISYIHKRTANTDNYIYDMHTHDFYELVLFIEGEANYLVEGKSFPIRSNSLIITRPGDVHCIKINRNSIDHRRAFWFDSSKIGIDIERFIPHDISVVNLEGNDSVLGVFKKIDYYYESFSGEDFEHILINIIEEILYNIKLIGEQDIFNENPLIKKALKLIEANIREPFNLDKICSGLYVSKSYLHRVFMNTLHITPKKYITLKRLSMAQKLIDAGKKPTDVAYLCGFTDYSCFYRLYKKQFGISPSNQKSNENILNNLH